MRRIVQAAAGLGIAIFLAGVALFAYTGTYSRYWADDYCYSAAVKQFGLVRGLLDWYQHSGNRLSTLAVVGFTDLFGWRSIQLISLAVLVVLAGAWVFCLFRLRRLFQWPVAGYWLVFLGSVEVYFAALLAPDRLQTFYWRMGTFHYTLPVALLLINLGFLAGGFRFSGKHILWIMLASGFLGLFAAGLSETFAAMQTGFFVLAILAVIVFWRGPGRLHGARLLAAPLAGSILTMLVMSLAPANAWRQAVMPPPDNPLLVIPYSLRFAGDFILYSIRGQIIPFLVYVLVIGLAGLLAVPVKTLRRSPRAGLGYAGISLLGMYILIVCSFAPSAYANLSYPAGRALMPACFALLAGLGAAAFILGMIAQQGLASISDQRGWLIAAAVLLAACSLYPFRAMTVVRSDIARLSIRAERWDARNAQIRQAIAVGTLDVQVQQVDVVQSLEDMGPDPTQWINACAAVFYDAHTITAK